jgi:prevent-host-death family protein
MIRVNIHEAKAHLSRYLEEVKGGETVLLCKRNQPVAEIRPIVSRLHRKRAIGLARGIFTVPDSFFEELPAEVLSGFSGEDG